MDTQHDNSNGFNFKEDLPNANASFVLGIIALVADVVLCICYGYVIGLILSIIGLILGINALSTYQLDPEKYTEKSYRKARMGRTLNLIGAILSFIMTVGIFYLAYQGLSGNLPPEFQDAFDEAMETYR